jgi:hypothetical protein
MNQILFNLGGVYIYELMNSSWPAHQGKKSPDFSGNSEGSGKKILGRCSSLALDPHEKLGLIRTGQSQRRDIYVCSVHIYV